MISADEWIQRSKGNGNGDESAYSPRQEGERLAKNASHFDIMKGPSNHKPLCEKSVE